MRTRRDRLSGVRMASAIALLQVQALCLACLVYGAPRGEAHVVCRRGPIFLYQNLG